MTGRPEPSRSNYYKFRGNLYCNAFLIFVWKVILYCIRVELGIVGQRGRRELGLGLGLGLGF